MSNTQVSQEYLLKHAYKNVWCTPEQDRQANLQLPRITPINGVWLNFNYQWRNFKMPLSTPGVRFHLYQIGQQFPELLGLLNQQSGWISAKEVMEANELMLDVYNAKGIIVPKSLCWYIISGDKNIILAVAKPSESPAKLLDVDLEEEPLFMRLYSNAYYHIANVNAGGQGILVHSEKPRDVSELNSFQTKIAQLPTTGGKFLYINGMRVNQIDLVSAKVGDYLEVVYDASIKREVYFKVRDLDEFESVLDNLHKFLLHYPGVSNVIDYQDDIDVYVGAVVDNNRWRGVYLHKNDSRTLRNLTHRDYSIPVIRVNGAKAANAFLADKQVEVRLTIRHSGYNRPLVFENNRIFELYKLPSDKIQKAMVGVDATVSVWNASALENSDYVKIMRQKQGAITKEMVQSAYGYNAISTLLGNTPKRVIPFSNQKLVVVPEGLRGCCTIYEYDAAGKLVYFTQHTVDATYSCQNPNTAFVECIYGLGGTSLDFVDNTTTGVLDPLQNYRFYTRDLSNAKWIDRTNDAYYLVTNNQYKWVVGGSIYNRVASNKKHLAYSFEMAPLAGVFEFDLLREVGGQYLKLDMALGELDLFFNGYSLIEGLDYIVKDARVVIIAKKYYNDSLAKQVITVRYTGFCNKDLTRNKPSDAGFVYHGALSANNRFDVRDDKVLRIVCGGVVKLRDQLSFAEDGVTPVLENVLNGAPYAIRDIVVPMNNYLISNATGEDKTYALRAASEVIDAEISDYLTVNLPQAPATLPNVIAGRYPLYSPFLSRILADLLSGALADQKFFEQFNDTWLKERLASYTYLLDFDLTAKVDGLDRAYCVVHPHPYPNYVTVNAYQWRIVQRAMLIFTTGAELSSTINVQ